MLSIMLGDEQKVLMLSQLLIGSWVQGINAYTAQPPNGKDHSFGPFNLSWCTSSCYRPSSTNA
jgi:hypothetical protein